MSWISLNSMNTLIETSIEREKRFFGQWRKIQLKWESTLLTQMQFWSWRAEVVLSEFLWLMQLPFYSRIWRYYKDEIEELLSGFTWGENVKFRLRKYGESHGKITVKTRLGIQNGYKVYKETDVLISAKMADLLFADVWESITPVKKRRYIILGPDDKPWDVDVYEEENSLLIVCEREAGSIRETFLIPKWIGREITSDKFWKPRISTAWLQSSPVETWSPTLKKKLFDILAS